MKMEHFYKRLPAFFTFPDFYDWVAAKAAEQQGALQWHGVEVGAYEGASIAYLGVELINRGVTARIDGVDWFPPERSVERIRAQLSPIESVLGTLHAGTTWEVASKYADGSLDFVFIDADHVYECIRKDIDAWLPKVRRGGIIAGHDFCNEFNGVIRAVTETFPRWTVWRGTDYGGDARMDGNYYPCWCVQR